MATFTEAYTQLKDRFDVIVKTEYARLVQNMVTEASTDPTDREQSSEKMVALAGRVQELISAPDLKGLIATAEAGASLLSPDDQRNLAQMKTFWVGRVALPAELSTELATLEAEGSTIHSKNKPTGDWSKMQPWIQHSFDIMRNVGILKQQATGAESVYEALLQHFSPGLSAKSVAEQMDVLERHLPKLIHDAAEHQKTLPPPIPLTGPFPWEQQLELNMRVAKALGFDFSRGKLDMIVDSPSCDGSRADTRLTTDFIENDFLNAVYSTAHETGHGFYRQNTPEAWYGQPGGMTMGMHIDESMSRLFEVYACGTPEFFQWLEVQAREVFNRPDDPALSAENLYRLKTKAEPSFIRVYADELTYPAHILLRYQLERDVINEKIDPKDLPEIWNQKMQELLGITPPTNTQGCMQDVHWPVGYIGYFPAYGMGNVGAAQFYQAALKAHPEIPTEIAKGNFKPLTDWLKENVHAKGSLYTADEVFVQATGESLTAKHYLDHLSVKFTGKKFDAPSGGPSTTIKNAL